jgi:hypothetical protein
MLCQVSCHPCGLAPITFQAGVALALSLSPSGPWGKAQSRQTSQTSLVSDAGGVLGDLWIQETSKTVSLHHVTIPRTVCISSVINQYLLHQVPRVIASESPRVRKPRTRPPVSSLNATECRLGDLDLNVYPDPVPLPADF